MLLAAAAPAAATLDHFLCYKVRTSPGTPRFAGTTLELTDQLEAKPFDVKKTKLVCTPVDKNGEGVGDAETRLMAYKIKRAPGAPQHGRVADLRVANQFGESVVDTVRESMLLVPAAACIDDPPGSCPDPVPAPDPLAHEVDHFACYKVTESAGAPKFSGATVTVSADELTPSTRQLEIGRPRHLCVPADKNGEGVKNPAASMLCYKAKPAPGAPKHVPIDGLAVGDQLGAETLKTKREAELCVPSTRSAFDRPADPVVLTGSDVPTLVGVAPDDLVAYRYSFGWVQVPVQVDERTPVNYSNVYNNIGSFGGGITLLDYTDAGTFAGPDPNAALDADDEIVFMAADAGDRPGPVGLPPGVLPGTGVEVAIVDPIGAGAAYVYLFVQGGSLDPGAGRQYVDYDFDLLSGPYLTTYDIADGPNPEDSAVVTDSYARHFSDRWVQDELRILAGTASGADILDRHKALFAPGVCGRSEDTFSDAEGAFVVNKSGPVRALRSYVGANSGPLTQRLHRFYRQREDVVTNLRVHAIPGVMDFFDYSAAASGMTYRNSLNVGGVTIDGVPDAVMAGLALWELVTGPQGSLVMVGLAETNMPGFAPTSYYLDDATPPVTQCTGDTFAYGSSGAWINQSIPDTDPRNGATTFLRSTRTIYYDAPGLGLDDAAQRAAWAANPLAASAGVWPSP